MARQTGITASTPQNIVMDGGSITLDFGLAGERLLGATQGGSTYNAEQEVRMIPVDGTKFALKGMTRVTGVTHTLVANLLEMSADNIALMLTGSTVTDMTTYDSITRSADIQLSDYFDNVAIAADQSNGGDPVIIILKNVLVTGNLSLSAVDDEESVVELTFTAHADPATPGTDPVEIRYPKIV